MQCKRNNGKEWRCPDPAVPGSHLVLCEDHLAQHKSFVEKRKNERNAAKIKASKEEVGCLIVDLQQVKDDLTEALEELMGDQQMKDLTEALEYCKEFMWKSSADIDALTIKVKDLEATCISQTEKIKTMKKKSEEQNILILKLQDRLAVAESKTIQLHTT